MSALNRPVPDSVLREYMLETDSKKLAKEYRNYLTMLGWIQYLLHGAEQQVKAGNESANKNVAANSNGKENMYKVLGVIRGNPNFNHDEAMELLNPRNNV